MKKWQRLALAVSFCSGLFMMSGALAASTGCAAANGIEEVVGIAEVYGDGEKIAAAALKYPKPIDPKTVSADDFSADGMTIESVAVSDTPNICGGDKEGRYVVLKFAVANTAYDGDLAQRANGKRRDESRKNDSLGGEAPMRSDRKLPDLSVRVRQTGTIAALDGTKYLPREETVASTATLEPAVDSFRQFVYTDKETGVSMPYNLFLPKNYDANKKYPLLFFVADASANINEVKTPLFQGNGATVWASPAEQKKHECIVLAPQYTADLVDELGMMTTDENKWTAGLALVSDLLFDVIDRYGIDRDRIYGTGQSQGGMTNIALSDKYPDLFAGQLLVACQWNVDEMEAMKDKNLWIVVCEGDTKAFPGMNAATAHWESLGSKVARNETFWDSKAPVAELDAKVNELAAQGARINYSVFAGGNHMYTWSFAYNIDALRDWLFNQRK